MFNQLLHTMHAALALLLALAGIACVESHGADLTLLDAESPGRCMDGSPGGYYYETASTAASSNKWIFDLQGGGECVTDSSCRERLSTSLGSSKHFFSRIFMLHHLSAGLQEENPYAHTWNRVFIPYCSSDLWSGTRTDNPNETFGLYFSGHLIVQEVFKHLQRTTNLNMASDVVVTGESAGGIGSWMNAGWFKQQLPKARTVVAPVAGFYAYAFPYVGPGAASPGVDFSPSAFPHYYNLWQSHVDDDCKKAYPLSPWFCMIANNSRPSIDVPAFVVEAQTDKIQLQSHDNLPSPPWTELPPASQKEVQAYVLEWKQNMTDNIHSRLRPSDGYFFPACYIHTTFSKKGPFITDQNSGKTYTYAEAFGEWHSALGTTTVTTGFRLEDTCGLFCGNSCSELPHTSDVVV